MVLKSLKVQVSRGALAVMALGILLPAASAQAQTPVFTPAKQWQVGATELTNIRGLENVNLPCVLSNEYDNGFVVRFSGGGGQILAMAVDFRQEIFSRGDKYNAMLSIGDDYAKQVSASAFTNSTLIFNLRPMKEFYGKLQEGKTLGLDIEGNVLKLSLGDVAGALPTVERCYAGEKMPVIKPPSNEGVAAAAVEPVEREEVGALPVVPATPIIPIEPQQNTLPHSMPKNLDDIVKAEPQPIVPVVPAPQTEAKIPAIPAPEAAPVPRAPELEAKPAVIAAPVPVPVPTPVPVPQPVNAAPDTVVSPQIDLPETGRRGPALAAGGPRVSRVTADAAPAVASAPAIVPAPVTAPVMSPAPVKSAAMWEAKAGEDMKTVFGRWADKAGYNLDWQSQKGGKLAHDVAIDGTFEEAVAQVMAVNGAASGLSSHIKTPEGSAKPVMPPAVSTVPTPAPVAAPVAAKPAPQKAHELPAYVMEWSAPKGANIRATLMQWSSRAGVALVWNAPSDFTAKAPVAVKGSYEAAVQTLLDQYLDDANRPVGRLNIDPATGKRTLTIDTQSGR